jgi:hypothetical protein
MSEESVKRQKRRLVAAVRKHFILTSRFSERLIEGQPFDLEFHDDYQTWMIRCVIGKVSEEDKKIVRKQKLISKWHRKAIAYRENPRQRGINLLEIK